MNGAPSSHGRVGKTRRWSRLLLVHAMNEDARSFYLHYGFEPSPSDPMNLQLLIKDVRATIAGP